MNQSFIINTRRKYEYDIMRIILTLLVVVGHLSLFRFADKNCGTVGNYFVQLLTDQVSEWIYGFHMYGFFFLSGCCFKLNKYESMDKLVKEKFKRLIIPYYIAGGGYICCKIFFGNVSGRASDC